MPEEYLMRWTVAEVEHVLYSGYADVFTGNTQHGALCSSYVVNRFPKDRACAPPRFYVVARHCHRRLHTAPIIRSFRNPGNLDKVQTLAAVVFSDMSHPPPAVGRLDTASTPYFCTASGL